jgi:hypothetical protein
VLQPLHHGGAVVVVQACAAAAMGVGSVASASASSSSYSFSPGRRPVKTIGISSSVWPGQADQVARQVDDLHRLAHVQHQHLAAVADGRGLQHQARGLGDGHEVANDVRVGDGDRAAAGDLFLELRDHAAAAAQHVAEAHRHEAGARVLGTRPTPPSRRRAWWRPSRWWG